MNCPHCSNEAERNTTTFTVDLGKVLIDVYQQIEKIVNAAKQSKQEVSIVDYRNVA
jgi:hypothetical protein